MKMTSDTEKEGENSKISKEIRGQPAGDWK